MTTRRALLAGAAGASVAAKTSSLRAAATPTVPAKAPARFPPAVRAGENLNEGWAFHRGDAPGAEKVAFDDSGWLQVKVPHDWSIMDLPGQSSPLDKDSAGSWREGYTVGGVGWYRRKITLPTDVAGKTVLLRFEAVYMDAEIWVNGAQAARHAYGYTAFDVDISNLAKPGVNVVAVRVDHQQPSSRWYAGSGIIRPVRLEVLDKVHVDPAGPYITTPKVSADEATAAARTQVVNASTAAVRARLTSIVQDATGREVRRVEAEQVVPATGRATFDQAVGLPRPALWSLKTPNLYLLVQEVRVDGVMVDSRRTRFGVRSISFDAQRGFLLNGEKIYLQGGNIHHDNYMLGAAGVPRADRRKVELLQSAGFNAIRNAHNPASQATLDAADELGMLVIDEAFDAWSQPKFEQDYARFFKDNWRSDLTSMVETGRNHPSVIMWSIGNEIRSQVDPLGVEEATMLLDHVRSLDPTRPVTASVHMFEGNKYQPFADVLDVAGYNYHQDFYLRDHQKHPKRVMYGSESFSRQAFEYWSRVESMPWVIGDFVWSAFDYMGESGVGWMWGGGYPWHLSFEGEIDVTGKLRPAAYYRRVLWKTGITPTSAFVEWATAESSLPGGGAPVHKPLDWVQQDLLQTWSDLRSIGANQVVVFSEDEEVELFVNGDSIGRKPVSRLTEYKTYFWVNYEPGELKVIGYRHGKSNSEWRMSTPGEPAAIRLTVDRPAIAADGDDLAYIVAEVVDSKGVPVVLPKQDRPLHFAVDGAGAVLAGVGNGNPIAIESFQSGVRSTYWGRAVAVVRAGKEQGAIKLSVTAPDLPSSFIDITSV